MSASVTIALIDYGAGNLRSAEKALERALHETETPGAVQVTAEPDVIAKADHIVLPGDGAFAHCRNALVAVPGLAGALEEAVKRRARPFLGICVGMQLLASVGEEHGTHAGLGWISGRVVKLAPADPALKIPHMGWNTLSVNRPHPVLAGVPLGADGLHAYFLHSYHVIVDKAEDLVAVADYGAPVSAIVATDTIVGTQFHPEKSQGLGMAILRNFVRWRP